MSMKTKEGKAVLQDLGAATAVTVPVTAAAVSRIANVVTATVLTALVFQIAVAVTVTAVTDATVVIAAVTAEQNLICA